jgi:hypothetical protein
MKTIATVPMCIFTNELYVEVVFSPGVFEERRNVIKLQWFLGKKGAIPILSRVQTATLVHYHETPPCTWKT